MKFVLYLGQSDCLQSALEIDAQEVVLQAASFSASGGLEDSDLFSVAKSVNRSGRRVTLQWDRYCRDDEIQQLADLLCQFSSELNAIRFADPGVGHFLVDEPTGHELQFQMWDGHQNRSGVLEWIGAFGGGLQRIVISNQVPFKTLRQLRRQTDLPLEINGLGRIQLFHSARGLLKGRSTDSDRFCLASTDRPNQFFPVRESEYGTVIFNDKELFLLDKIPELKEAGIDYLGLNPGIGEHFRLLASSGRLETGIEEIRKSWKTPLTTGFFEENQTDASLTKLTNAFLKDERDNRIATVLESSKNSHTLIQLHQAIELPCEVLFLTPERKTIPFQIVSLQSLKRKCHNKSAAEDVYLLPWIKYVVPATIMTEKDQTHEI